MAPKRICLFCRRPLTQRDDEQDRHFAARKFCDSVCRDGYQSSGWTTEHEIIFLSGIGRWGTYKKDRIRPLRGYISSCNNRDDWGGIDKQKVLEYAKSLLEMEESRKMYKRIK